MKGGFQRVCEKEVKIISKGDGDFERAFENICKGFVSSCRWVGERSDVARFGRGT